MYKENKKGTVAKYNIAQLKDISYLCNHEQNVKSP